MDQLEYYDTQKNKPDSSIRGPGFLVHFIKKNVAVPEDFETSHTRQRREEARKAQDREAEDKMRLESLYEDYCRQEVDRYIAGLDRSEYEGLLRQKRQELLKQDSRYSKWLENVFADHVNRRVRADIAAQAGLLTFHSFCARESSQAIRDNSAGGT